MAYVPYVRMVFGGKLEGNQGWSCGMSFTNDGTATTSELNTWLLAQDALLKTWLGGTIKTSLWDTSTNYSYVSAYSYPAVGHSASLASVGSSGVVGTGSSQCPNQCAAIYSLRSGQGGRSGRGRFYMPVTQIGGLDATGQILTTPLGTLVSQFKTYVDAANLLSIGSAPAILGIAGRTSGLDQIAVSFRLNTKLYTQRRRIDKLAANTVTNQPF